ncbi:MAG: ferritin family protein [Deltaproteobacteria bacterium]|nr:ferritin family protein [Deltaproteobacteria bacterium]MBW1960721.1 ferritin family protein [Deltaproteobacteria bacterium]MBW1993246.1 ferritin family protein [Deltaproteobacteria bacterium]MBW2151987.1 ferritin family protein [Deltaproteobacteria bacterium]
MNFKNLQEVIDFAIEKEIEAADFYEQVSQQESMSGAKDMLLEFAAEEKKHRRLLEELKNKGIVEGISEYKFKWIPDIKRSNYITEMEYRPGMTYSELLLLAMKREEKALALYNQLLEQAEGESSKHLFKMLCQEEAKHKLALETKYDDYMAEMGD